MSNAVTNHRPQRKQLSEQLDRLDGLIDLLADQLPQAVADATREGTRQAVRDVLAELFADPGVVARFRAALPTGNGVAERKPGTFARLKSAVRAGVTRVKETVKAVADRVKNAAAATRVRVTNAATTTRVRVRTTISRIAAAYRTLTTAVPLGRFAAVAVGVGVLVMTASYVAPHPVAALVGGIGATVTAAAVQVGGWVRRSARSLGLGG
jgi:hypothetical protein